MKLTSFIKIIVPQMVSRGFFFEKRDILLGSLFFWRRSSVLNVNDILIIDYNQLTATIYTGGSLLDGAIFFKDLLYKEVVAEFGNCPDRGWFEAKNTDEMNQWVRRVYMSIDGVVSRGFQKNKLLEHQNNDILTLVSEAEHQIPSRAVTLAKKTRIMKEVLYPVYFPDEHAVDMAIQSVFSAIYRKQGIAEESILDKFITANSGNEKDVTNTIVTEKAYFDHYDKIIRAVLILASRLLYSQSDGNVNRTGPTRVNRTRPTNSS